MKCENSYCVYQKQGKCTLDQIQINISGMCSECIYVDLEDSVLDKAKDKLLNSYGFEL